MMDIDPAPQPRRRKTRIALLLALSSALAAGPVSLALAQGAPEGSAPESAAPTQQQPLPSFAPEVDKVLPAVVNISVVEKSDAAPVADEEDAAPDDQQLPGFPGGTPFDDMLRHFFEQQPGRMAPGPRPQVMALGSGFIIDPAGYVVTNNHVVGDAAKVTVVFQDGSEHRAKIVGKDAKTDLALLKIDAPKPLPYVQWGDSGKERIGDWVLAVGNPFGLGGTVTKGIISAKSRSLDSSSYVDYLQIDAAVNRGNSGGPTFDLDGHVVGINTAIYSPNGGNVGIAFDIPSDTAKAVIDQIKAKGHVDRGYLGVEIQQVTPDLAAAIGIDKDGPQGALVASVKSGGPAAKAGVEVGDVIRQVNGQSIDKTRDLPRLIAETSAGTTVRLTVLRHGKPVELEATVGHLDEAKVASADRRDEDGTDHATLGMRLTSLNSALRSRLHLGRDTKGAVITHVENGSAADSVGLEGGDVIERVDGQSVKGPEDAKALLAEAEKTPKKPILLLIDRHGAESFIAMSQTPDGTPDAG
ncbi:serine protease [Aliidongia dinghuensis]|uniref:Probable periplasmic serine endoprotease DegP-like n=1 Tax=Aliidongia dinghuensis TaxID=1867774 RepID=A0A8J2YST2_9PROT|nr:DegQ family serine endoprotease [Aliidongia dinghuensis]GGF12977.1 serine protease [Aliidongia dinghuensis]